MKNNFNNKTMVNNGVKALNNFGSHKPVTVGQVVAAIVIFNVVGACVMKGTEWLRKKEKARRLAEINNDIDRYWNSINEEK